MFEISKNLNGSAALWFCPGLRPKTRIRALPFVEQEPYRILVFAGLLRDLVLFNIRV